MVREDGFNLDSFTLDSVDGLSPNMERGKLGLVEAKSAKLNKSHLYSVSFLEGKHPGVRDQASVNESKYGLDVAENGMKDGINNSRETMNDNVKQSLSK